MLLKCITDGGLRAKSPAARRFLIFWQKIAFLTPFGFICQPVGRAVTRSSLEREIWGSNLRPVKSDTGLPTARHRCDISSKEALLIGRKDAEMGPANSLHSLAYYDEYNERFDLIWITFCTFLEPFEKNKLPKFASHLKELNCPPLQPLLLTGQVQNTFKLLYFGLHFLSGLAKRG